MHKKTPDIKILFSIVLLVVAALTLLASSAEGSDLFNELTYCECLDRSINEKFPVYYNNLLYGGYINMPSARMGDEGEIGAGYASVPPYHLYNARLQLTPNIEFSANYRIFKGVPDPVLSQFGFGDFSDKGANVKFALFTPEDSCYLLPGIAIGFEDFIGTKAFKANYIVLTKVFNEYDTEISVGYGGQRIHDWFGGLHVLPFRKHPLKFLRPLCFTAEYDAIDYKDINIEPHPEGRRKKNCINWGAKYRLLDYLDLSMSYIRGEKIAFSASTFYNWGNTEGFVPKIKQPTPYCRADSSYRIDPTYTTSDTIAESFHLFKKQGFEVLNARLGYDECARKTLRIYLLNCCYRTDAEVRKRLSCLLSHLIPDDIDKVIIVMDGEGFPIQEYRFDMFFLRLYGYNRICDYELAVVSPMKEVSCPNPFDTVIFKKNRKRLCLSLGPKTNFLFGSAQGKFKYNLGLKLTVSGYLWKDLYYSVKFGYIFVSDIDKLTDFDRLNPSQIVNVHTDIVNYYKNKGLTVDEAYIQKNWNLGSGYFSRISLGIYEQEYAGAAAELLFYPLKYRWALGIEGAILQKRTYDEWGFTNTFRKMHGFTPEYIQYTPSQFFISYYYDFRQFGIDLKIKGGKFVADDWGIKYEVTRYYKSGLKIFLWYTATNGHDKVNGQIYHDKGIGFSMPLDIFSTCCSRDRWGNAMSAWLRDVGYSSYTGRSLYNLIRDQREGLID